MAFLYTLQIKCFGKMEKFLKNKKKIIVILFVLLLVVMVYFFKNPLNAKQNEPTQVAMTKSTENNINPASNDEIFEFGYIDEVNMEELLKYNVPVLIDFGADYCQPCKDFDVTLKKIKELYGKEIIIKKVDIEEHPDLAEEYGAYLIPMQLYFYADGKPYVPSKNLSLNMELIANDDNEHILTKHFGGSSYGKMMLILNELGAETPADEDTFD